MQNIAGVSDLTVGVFLRETELLIDPADGFITASPTLRLGDRLTLRLQVKKNSARTLFAAKSGGSTWLSFSPRAKSAPVGQCLNHSLPLAVRAKGGLRLAHRYPKNILRLVFDKQEGAMIPRVSVFAIVGQRGSFFLRCDDMLNPTAYEQELSFAGFVTSKLPPRAEDDSRDAKERAEGLWGLIESQFGFVLRYDPISGKGTVILPDDTQAHVRWDSIVTRDRFAELKHGWGVRFAEKVEQGGEPTWQLRGVTVIDKRE